MKNICEGKEAWKSTKANIPKDIFHGFKLPGNIFKWFELWLQVFRWQPCSPLEITCSKLAIKTPERRQWRRFGVFIVNLKHISNLVLVFLLLTLSREIPAGKGALFSLNTVCYFMSLALHKIDVIFPVYKLQTRSFEQIFSSSAKRKHSW